LFKQKIPANKIINLAKDLIVRSSGTEFLIFEKQKAKAE